MNISYLWCQTDQFRYTVFKIIYSMLFIFHYWLFSGLWKSNHECLKSSSNFSKMFAVSLIDGAVSFTSEWLLSGSENKFLQCCINHLVLFGFTLKKDTKIYQQKSSENKDPSDSHCLGLISNQIMSAECWIWLEGNVWKTTRCFIWWKHAALRQLKRMKLILRAHNQKVNLPYVHLKTC